MRIFIRRNDGETSVMRLIGTSNPDEAVEKWKASNPGKYLSHRVARNDEPNPERVATSRPQRIDLNRELTEAEKQRLIAMLRP